MRSLLPLLLLTAAGCSPSFDGEVDEYAVAGDEGAAGTAIKGARDDEPWHPCEVVADEKCIRSFGACPDRFVDTTDHADAFECAEVLRQAECWDDESVPPKAMHHELGETCVQELVELPRDEESCDAAEEILMRCDEELWASSECTESMEIGERGLTIPSEGASFSWGGRFVSVCVEVDAAAGPLVVRTLDAGAEGLDTLLLLYAPSGELLESNDDDPDRQGLLSKIVIDEPAESGTYTVVVAGYDAKHAGAVRLEISRER